jgi:hypothetical protein
MTIMNGNTVETQAHTVGTNLTSAQETLMFAYSVKEGDKDAAGKLEALRTMLNVQVQDKETGKIITPDLKGLQLIAQQRFEHASQIFNMFSSLIDKINNMKQRLIQKFGQN